MPPLPLEPEIEEIAHSRPIWYLRPLLRWDPKRLWTYARGTQWPGLFCLALPFIVLFIYVYHLASRSINWKAALPMLALSECMFFFWEHWAISRGHWVYNCNILCGVFIWGVPLEELLIFYWIPPLFVVCTMLLIYRQLKKRTGRVARHVKYNTLPREANNAS